MLLGCYENCFLLLPHCIVSAWENFVILNFMGKHEKGCTENRKNIFLLCWNWIFDFWISYDFEGTYAKMVGMHCGRVYCRIELEKYFMADLDPINWKIYNRWKIKEIFNILDFFRWKRQNRPVPPTVILFLDLRVINLKKFPRIEII